MYELHPQPSKFLLGRSSYNICVIAHACIPVKLTRCTKTEIEYSIYRCFTHYACAAALHERNTSGTILLCTRVAFVFEDEPEKIVDLHLEAACSDAIQYQESEVRCVINRVKFVSGIAS